MALGGRMRHYDIATYVITFLIGTVTILGWTSPYVIGNEHHKWQYRQAVTPIRRKYKYQHWLR